MVLSNITVLKIVIIVLLFSHLLENSEMLPSLDAQIVWSPYLEVNKTSSGITYQCIYYHLSHFIIYTLSSKQNYKRKVFGCENEWFLYRTTRSKGRFNMSSHATES